MDTHLVHVANDIAMFHGSFPEEEAMQTVSEHINKSWAHSMRQKPFEEFQVNPSAFDNLIAKSLLKINCGKYHPIKAQLREKGGPGG